MTIPLQVTFHGGAHQRVIESLIAERVAKLAHYYPRVQSCRVVIDSASHNHQNGNEVTVKVEVGIPGRDPIFVNHHTNTGDDIPDLRHAVRDSFTAAERQLRDLHDKQVEVGRAPMPS